MIELHCLKEIVSNINHTQSLAVQNVLHSDIC